MLRSNWGQQPASLIGAVVRFVFWSRTSSKYLSELLIYRSGGQAQPLALGMATPYAVLGLAPNASKDQVSCMRYRGLVVIKIYMVYQYAAAAAFMLP